MGNVTINRVMSNLFDKVINEALNGGIDYQRPSDEIDMAYSDYVGDFNQLDLPGQNPITRAQFTVGWNAAMAAGSQKMSPEGEKEFQDHPYDTWGKPHSDDGLPALK